MNPYFCCGFPAAESCPKTNPCELHELRVRVRELEAERNLLQVGIEGTAKSLEEIGFLSTAAATRALIGAAQRDGPRALGMAREVKP